MAEFLPSPASLLAVISAAPPAAGRRQRVPVARRRCWPAGRLSPRSQIGVGHRPAPPGSERADEVNYWRRAHTHTLKTICRFGAQSSALPARQQAAGLWWGLMKEPPDAGRRCFAPARGRDIDSSAAQDGRPRTRPARRRRRREPSGAFRPRGAERRAAPGRIRLWARDGVWAWRAARPSLAGALLRSSLLRRRHCRSHRVARTSSPASRRLRRNGAAKRQTPPRFAAVCRAHKPAGAWPARQSLSAVMLSMMGRL
jgi:hypothetical protein